MIGACQSALILLPHPPNADCCSVSARSPKACLLHKLSHHNAPLHGSWDLGDGRTCDVHNNRPAFCEGAVQSKDGFDFLFAAMTHLHDGRAKRLHSAGRALQRSGCFSNFKQGGDFVTGFDPHKARAGGPSKRRCEGNPPPSKTIKSLVDWLDKESERRGCQVKEKPFILPRDLLACRGAALCKLPRLAIRVAQQSKGGPRTP